MAPTEMMQTSSQMALAQPGTPPSSPNQSEHMVGWNNDHQFIDVLKAIVDMQIASAPAPAPPPKWACSHTSAESQTVQTAQLTVDLLEQFISKLIDAKSNSPKPSKDATPGDPQPEISRASKLEFKTVIEVYVSGRVVIKHS
jgi:hypothetical protein